MQAQGGADNAHAANEFSTHLGQRAEHMLDACAWCGDAAVALFLRVRDAALGGAFALDVHAPAGLGQILFALGAGVAAIGIHIAAGIGRIEQRFEHGGVGDCGVGDG